MNQYLLIKREVCPECKGHKWLEHPLWQELGKDIAAGKVKNEPSAYRKWFHERSFDNEPPEEYECPNCEGRGTVEHEIDLLQALGELGITQSSIEALRERVETLESESGLEESVRIWGTGDE